MLPVPAQSNARLDLFAVPALVTAFLFIAFAVAVVTHDALMATQAWTFIAGFSIALLWMIRRYADGIPPADQAP